MSSKLKRKAGKELRVSLKKLKNPEDLAVENVLHEEICSIEVNSEEFAMISQSGDPDCSIFSDDMFEQSDDERVEKSDNILKNIREECDGDPDYSIFSDDMVGLSDEEIREESGIILEKVTEECNDKINQNKKTREARKKKECPICKRNFLHLGPHLSSSHGLEKDACMSICYSLRKRMDHGQKGRKCPLPSCINKMPFKCLDKHLQFKHHLKKDDPVYRKFIRVRVTSNGAPWQKYSSFSQFASVDFQRHLLTLDGGTCNAEAANQQRLHLRQILQGLHVHTYYELVSEDGINKMQEWFTVYCRTHEASSAVTYLATMICFLQYLLNFKKVVGLDQTKFSMIKARLNKWKASFRKLKMGKLSYDIPDISSTDINCIYHSVGIREAKDIIKAMLSNQKFDLTAFEHSISRNAILMLSVLRNGCRSCALYNLMLEEFLTATKIEDSEDYYVIKVRNHKTVAEHGPAEIVLDVELYTMYQNYCNLLRSKILSMNCATSNFFFLTWSAKNISSADVYQGLLSVWKRAGLNTNVGTSLIRKLITTEVHDNQRHLIPNVAAHLKHKVSTAERNYKILKKSSVSVETSIAIRNILRGNNPSSDSNSANGSNADSTSLVTEDNPWEQSLNQEESYIPRQKGRAFYSAIEREQIKKTFHTYVRQGIVPKLKTIRDIVVLDDVIKRWPEEKQNSTKIKGCLQNFRNKFIRGEQ